MHVLIDPDRVHIVLTGEIDASTAPDLSTAALEALSTGRPIEVDCRYVTFMDSTGVGFLARLAARSSTRVRLLHPTPMVRFLLDTVMISDLVTFVEDDPEAPQAAGPVPDSAVPDSAVPDSAVPDSAVPDSAVPGSTAGSVPDSPAGSPPSSPA